MAENKPYRILSIDGGGFLGLYSAKILEYIKTVFLPSKDFCDYFNLITGTSTGGIIALSLSIRKHISEIVNFYMEYGPMIFPYKNRIINLLMTFKSIFGTKYSNRTILNIVSSFFKGAQIKDCICDICIPAIDIVNCQPIVFKTPHNTRLGRDNDFYLRDVALATASAPIYFPIYSFNNFPGLVDGGLWQNNPSLIGVIEACNFFVGPNKMYNSIEILSIGNPLSNIKKSISVKNKISSILK